MCKRIAKERILNAKERIQKYYETKNLAEWYKGQEQRLLERLEQIDTDRKHPYFNMSLSTDLRGIKYDNPVVSGGGLPTSTMEREIEQIPIRLEREYDKTRAELLRIRQEMRKIETKAEQMQFYISLLDRDKKAILERKYEKRETVTKIALEMNVAKSTVCKYLNDTYCMVAEWILCYEENPEESVWSEQGRDCKVQTKTGRKA